MKKLEDSFFNEEIRCEYKVTREIKQVWGVLLGVLDCIQKVCEEHNLQYWAIQGTLLGAIRHQGFIPWDDDMDICMPRHDYEILQAHPEWIESPYELHIPNNEETYYEGWLRIHDTRTAILYPNYQKEGSKQGIYIDIFPMDYAGKNDVKNRKKIQIINNIGHAITHNVNPHFIAKAVSAIGRKTKIFKPETLYRWATKLGKDHDGTSQWGFKVFTVYPLENSIFQVSDFAETIQLPFENTVVNIPAGYDNILRTNYGDYMEFPPVEKRGKWHIFSYDTEHSYKDYNKK